MIDGTLDAGCCIDMYMRCLCKHVGIQPFMASRENLFVPD